VALADRLRDEYLRLAERSGWRQCPLCGNGVGAVTAAAPAVAVVATLDACDRCRGDVPAGAGFCPWCGVPRTEAVEQPEVEPPRELWETVEIDLWRGYYKSHFYALARDNGAGKVVAASGDFRLRGREVRPEADAVRAAHAAVVEALVAAGWEEVEPGEAWYKRRFRRLGDPAPA
jgi:hypothetical protein